MSHASTPPVMHDAAASQFEIRTPAGSALLRYVLTDAGALDLVHTEVPPEFEGQGYGGALVEAALTYARAEGTAIIPTCPFVRHYVDTHPEHAEVVSPRGAA
jgi:uncharacterized protein